MPLELTCVKEKLIEAFRNIIMKIKTFTFVAALVLLASAVLGEEYQDQWGPEIGSELPDLVVKDTEGNDRSVDDLRGERKGLLLFFARTSNW